MIFRCILEWNINIRHETIQYMIRGNGLFSCIFFQNTENTHTISLFPRLLFLVLQRLQKNDT
ncbi:MAG: hypothetical protein C4527_18445 [Candidatus Omnitrophota bacterium]|nr:MAG: hypothetical protein C4527_18445 [Candidatus Omnitrophota bacterium]